MNSVFNIRWPDTGLESRLKALALANRRSLHGEVLVALERYVGLALPAVAPEAIQEDALERVQSGGLPSAAQVAKRSFKPDFK